MSSRERDDDAFDMSDASLQIKTRLTWEEWFAVLDAEGAERMSHRQLVSHLKSAHGLEAPYNQIIASGYEQSAASRRRG